MKTIFVYFILFKGLVLVLPDCNEKILLESCISFLFLLQQIITNSVAVVFHSLSRVQLFGSMDCSMPGFPVLQHLLEFAQLLSTESVRPSNHLILCCPLFFMPSVFPSIKVFSNEPAVLIRWPKYCNFSISPSNEYSGFISFRMDWFDLISAQVTLKSLLQHHSSKASIL